MDRTEIVEALRAFPCGLHDCWLLAGGAMVLYGLREQTADLDLGCGRALADRLEADGCPYERTADGKRRFRLGEIELFEDWLSGPVTLRDGLPVVTPEGLLAMKRALGREKDLADLARLEAFLQRGEGGTGPRALGGRVLVVGCPGSGKSRFSLRLREKTGLPLIHLDNVWWRPDRSHITREAFDQRLAELLRGERWIIEGDYSRTCETRIRACETVIFLDYEEAVCMQGIIERVGQARPDIPWTEQRLDPELAAMVRGYRAKERPVLLELLARYPEKRTLIFKSRGDADAWLEQP